MTVVDLRGVLLRAADALHDAAWVMDGAKASPPLPAPVTLVLPQTRQVEAEVRALVAALDSQMADDSPEFFEGTLADGIE